MIMSIKSSFKSLQICLEMTVILGSALINNFTLRKAISPPPITVTGFFLRFIKNWETFHYKMLLYSAIYIQ